MIKARITSPQPESFYFGKYPARGDFVKSSNGGAVIQVFDQWISQAIDLMSSDPRWKIAYDSAPALNFAFVGTRAKLVVAGTLISSHDSGQRRFPFTLAARFETDDPLNFAASSPLLLDRYWKEVQRALASLREAGSDSNFHTLVAGTTAGLNPEYNQLQARFDEFMQEFTVEELEQELAKAGHACSLRQSVLGLGMLLQPIITHGASNLQKGLVFPMPNDGKLGPLTAAFWLKLAEGFLKRHQFELALFVSKLQGKPALLVGFVGASPKALASLLNPDGDMDYQVHIGAADWVEEYVEADAGMRKLSSYMQHPQLSLKQVMDTFNEVFLGL